MKSSKTKLSLFFICAALISSLTGFILGKEQSNIRIAELNKQLSSLKERLRETSQLNLQNIKHIQAAKANADKLSSESSKASLLEKVVNHANEEDLNELLTHFFQEEDLYGIHDSRQFSERLISELRLEDTPVSEFSVSSIGISLSQESTEHYEKDFFLKNREKLYAHIDTQGGLGANSHSLFVRWTRTDDNYVLLFEKKSVKSDSSTNWVSFIPDQRWQAGTYTVSFFTFDSALNKLATTQFFIHESP